MPALGTRAVIMSSLGLLEAPGRPELVPRSPDRVLLPGLEILRMEGQSPDTSGILGMSCTEQDSETVLHKRQRDNVTCART